MVQLCLMFPLCEDPLHSSLSQICSLSLLSSLLQPWVWVGLESGRVHLPQEKTDTETEREI